MAKPALSDTALALAPATAALTLAPAAAARPPSLIYRMCDARVDNAQKLIDLLGEVLQLPTQRSSLWALSATSQRMFETMQEHLRRAREHDALELSEALGVPLATLPTLERLAVESMSLHTARLLGTHICKGGAAPCIERVILNESEQFPNLRKLKLGPLATRKAGFTGREFTDAHALLIAQVCSRATLLRELWLGTNEIGDVGAGAIGAALSRSSLERLDLTCNGFGDDGALRLAAGLAANHSMRHLHLDGNRIGDAGADALCQALLSNPAMRKCTLYLTANPLTKAGMSACRAAAKRAPTFRLSLL